MSSILTARPGRLLTVGACGLAVLVSVLSARGGFASVDGFLVIVVLASLAVAYAWRRSSRQLDRLRQRALVLLIEANRRFATAPDEAHIRRGLAEAIADLTGRGAAVSGSEAPLQWRAGKALGWRGALEAELIGLSEDAMAAVGAPILTLGAFHARTDGLNSRVLGAAIWAAPTGSRALVRETDHYAALLIELAGAAIVRRRLDYPANRLRSVRVSPVSADAASAGLVTSGRFPAA